MCDQRIYVQSELYKDTLIKVSEGTCLNSVSFAIGRGDNERITLTVNDEEVFDRLIEAATKGKRILRAIPDACDHAADLSSETGDTP